MGEIKPGAKMVGAVRQHVPELVGGAFAIALEEERGAEAVQRAHITRHEHQSMRERDLGVRRIGLADVDAAELDREVRHRWRELEPLLEGSFGFVVAAQRAKDEAKLVERRREYGPAGRSRAQATSIASSLRPTSRSASA